MFNRDRFHNQLAINLGYQRLLNDNCCDLKVEETGDDAISVCIMGYGENFDYKEPESDYESCIKNVPPVMREVITAVHNILKLKDHCMDRNVIKTPIPVLKRQKM